MVAEWELVANTYSQTIANHNKVIYTNEHCFCVRKIISREKKLRKIAAVLHLLHLQKCSSVIKINTTTWEECFSVLFWLVAALRQKWWSAADPVYWIMFLFLLLSR